MKQGSQLTGLGGIILTVGGVLYFFAGLLHPQGGSGAFHEAITTMLEAPKWPIAHWFALISILLCMWAVWLLVDGGATQTSAVAHAGARLTILSGVFMAVQFAVELASESAVQTYATGADVPMVALTESMQAVGWPALNIGWILLALGLTAVAPLAVRIIGAVGALGMGLGGLFTMGFHLSAAGPLFITGVLLAIWMVWVGVAIALGRGAATRTAVGA